jgi:hypothetical protein
MHVTSQEVSSVIQNYRLIMKPSNSINIKALSDNKVTLHDVIYSDITVGSAI